MSKKMMMVVVEVPVKWEVIKMMTSMKKMMMVVVEVEVPVKWERLKGRSGDASTGSRSSS